MDNPDLKSIQTGDLLLFSNWSHSGLGVRLATASSWNHIGIAVWIRSRKTFELLPGHDTTLMLPIGQVNDNPVELYVFETNNNSVYDPLTSRISDGSRLVALSTLLGKYTHIAWRPLRLSRDVDYFTGLWKFIEEYSGQPYHKNKIRMILSALEVHLDRVDPPGGDIFCSQLVARYLQRFGLLRTDVPAYTFLPRHYAAADKSGKVPADIFLSEEIVIYSKPNLEWYWLGVLAVALLVTWISIVVYSRWLNHHQTRNPTT